MTLFPKLLAFSALLMLIALVLFMLFGQITVRRLRKNSEKNGLGVEFASGWDILNVAQALALPRYITQKLAKSPISGLYAERDLLEKQTSVFDRGLARIFWYTYAISVALMLTFIIANSVGLLD